MEEYQGKFKFALEHDVIVDGPLGYEEVQPLFYLQSLSCFYTVAAIIFICLQIMVKCFLQH